MIEMQGPESRPNVLIRVLAVLCALLLTAGVVGLITVGDEDRAVPDVAAVLAAADKTFDGTARFTMQMRVDAEGMASLGEMLKAEGHSDFAGAGVVMTMTAPTGVFEMRATEQTSYLRASGRWYAVDTAELVKYQEEHAVPGLEALSGPSIGTADPSAAFELLRQQGVITRAERVGDETVRGEPTTVYRLLLDPGVLKQNMPAEVAKVIDVNNVRMDIAIDGAGLVRRNQVVVTVSGGKFSATLTMTMEYFDFGVPVVVEEPPASEVTRVQTVEDFQRLIGTGG